MPTLFAGLDDNGSLAKALFGQAQCVALINIDNDES